MVRPATNDIQSHGSLCEAEKVLNLASNPLLLEVYRTIHHLKLNEQLSSKTGDVQVYIIELVAAYGGPIDATTSRVDPQGASQTRSQCHLEIVAIH